jgi:HlyD family secretion protein
MQSLKAWLTQRRNTLIIGLALLAIFVLFIAVRKLRGQEVEAIIIRTAPLVQSVVVSGRMATESRVFLGSTVTGRVEAVKYREGAQAKAGEWLVKLEDAELGAAARQAAAALRSAEARLDSQRRLAGPIAQQGLEQARSNAMTAERERDRSESLFKQGFIGQSRLDEVRRTAEVAKSQLRAAEAQSEANQKGAELEQAIARVAEARAAADLANARLAQTRIVAPADGLVLTRLVEPGQIVQAGTRLLEMSIRGPQQLIAQVDEKFLSQLKIGQLASVSADAFPNDKFSARISSIAPVIDAQRGSVEVKFSLEKPPEFLRNDMTLSIDVQTARRDNVIAIPAEALRDESNVLVINDGLAEVRKLQLGIRTLSAVEVLDGLRLGDAVVIDRAVVEGTRVRVAAHKSKLDASRSNLSTDTMKTMTRE